LSAIHLKTRSAGRVMLS